MPTLLEYSIYHFSYSQKTSDETIGVITKKKMKITKYSFQVIQLHA